MYDKNTMVKPVWWMPRSKLISLIMRAQDQKSAALARDAQILYTYPMMLNPQNSQYGSYLTDRHGSHIRNQIMKKEVKQEAKRSRHSLDCCKRPRSRSLALICRVLIQPVMIKEEGGHFDLLSPNGSPRALLPTPKRERAVM